MQAQRRPLPPAANPSPHAPAAGSTYRFLVRSAEEAAGVIRAQLGEHTRVVSVRSVKAPGFSGLLGGTRIEVIAQVQAPTAGHPAVSATHRQEVPGASATSAETPLSPLDRPDRLELSARANAADRTMPAGELPASPAGRDLSSAHPPASLPASAAGERGPGAGPAGLYLNGSSAAAPAPARPRRNPPPQRIDALLRRSGFSEALIERLRSLARPAGETDQPLHLGLSAVAEEIRTITRVTNPSVLPNRAAFLGMSGVGRTTALCKWLAQEVVTRGQTGAVATVEFERPHANEDLAVFAELLGVGFARQHLPVDPRGEAFAYFDLPPLSLTRAPENEKIREFLDEQAIPGRVLVLSALHDPTLLRQACTLGQDLGCTHLIFTHLDELPLWGKLWDFLIDAPLTPLLLSHGPSQTGECETDVVGAVLRRTFPWN